jgi:putative sterol carrier protein
MDSDDYVKMMSGELNPMMAFMSGKVKVDGDLNSVMKMQSLFGM